MHFQYSRLYTTVLTKSNYTYLTSNSKCFEFEKCCKIFALQFKQQLAIIIHLNKQVNKLSIKLC